MLSYRIFFVMLSAIFIVGHDDAHAGAWTKAKGTGFTKLGFRIIRANEYYEPGGNKVDIATFAEYTSSLYTEYGFHDRLTLIASVPFFKRITINRQEGTSGTVFFPGDEKNGFADTDLGARFRIWKNDHSVLSTEVLFGLPLGDNTQENGLYTGDGEFNQLVKLQYGYSAYPKPFYVGLELGYNNRTEGYSDEIIYGAEFGYRFNRSWLLAIKLRGVESRENGLDSVSGGTAGLSANNQHYLAYGPELSFFINQKWGISFSAEGATMAENVVAAPAFSIGFFLNQ